MPVTDPPRLPEIVVAGQAATVAYAVTANGKIPARDFLESDQIPPKDLAVLSRLFELMAQEGRIGNREKFKKVQGDIWEFKSYQIRIGAFQCGSFW